MTKYNKQKETQNNMEINPSEIETIYGTTTKNALAKAIGKTKDSGIILTMPELIKLRAIDEEKKFSNISYVGLSEQNIGIDYKGIFYEIGEHVFIAIHGGGLITPEKISENFEENKFQNNFINYSIEEINNLLEGKIRSEQIPMYSIQQILKGDKVDERRFGVVSKLEDIRNSLSGKLNKYQFMNNISVIMQSAGSTQYLEQFFENNKDEDNMIGNHHIFNNFYPLAPQGILSSLCYSSEGINGMCSLNRDARFAIQKK